MTTYEWQPIETVPKDGRFVLVFSDGVPIPVMARWDFYRGALESVAGPWDARDSKASHWVALPNLPESK